MNNYYTLISLLLFLLDRLSKYVVIYYVPYYRINQYMSIDLVFNRGMSFGMFHSQDDMIFSAVNFVVCCIVLMLVIHTHNRIVQQKNIIGECLIFVGALSNLLDRSLYAGVVDFVALSYQDWHFAVFNGADAFICFGVLFMLIIEYQESWA